MSWPRQCRKGCPKYPNHGGVIFRSLLFRFLFRYPFYSQAFLAGAFCFLSAFRTPVLVTNVYEHTFSLTAVFENL